MTNKKQVKKAARNVKRTRTSAKTTKQQKTNFWGRTWTILCWPFKKIAQACRHVWAWIRTLDLVCLANSALIIAIIVLFTMLIIDVVNCRRQQIIVISEPVPVVATQNTKNSDNPTLPIVHGAQQTVTVAPVNVAEVAIVKKQTAKQDNKLMGDVIIDSRSAGAILTPGTQVRGNLYLQNMRKFVLPCDVRINGNLFLRDVNMLQFCGDFVVTGNIYVSPRSSFGPIPKTARVGGYVVL